MAARFPVKPRADHSKPGRVGSCLRLRQRMAETGRLPGRQLAFIGQIRLRRLTEITRQPVPGKHRVGDKPRRLAIANMVDARADERPRLCEQCPEKPVTRGSRGHDHQRDRFEPRLPAAMHAFTTDACAVEPPELRGRFQLDSLPSLDKRASIFVYKRGDGCCGIQLEVGRTVNGETPIAIRRTGAQRAGPPVPVDICWPRP